MIKLYTSTDFFKPEEIIIDNESFFNNIDISSFTARSIDVMKKIDQAELLDKNTGKIETPFGITSIMDLSTGCKTVLNMIYHHENPQDFPTIRAINATECGWNAIEALLTEIDEHCIDISIVIEHDDDLYKCSNRDYMINDKYPIQSLALLGGYRQEAHSYDTMF